MTGSLNNNDFPLPDLSYLKKMANGDDIFLKEMIALFIEDYPVMLKAIKDSAEAGDHDQLMLLTHRLIPQLTFVGILSAIPDVTKINKDSREMDDLNERIAHLEEILSFSVEYLRKMI